MENLLEEVYNLPNTDNISETNFLGRGLKYFDIEEILSTKDWAEKYRFLTADISSRPGRMDCSETPWMLFVHDCFDNPDVRIIVGRKSAQIAWTETVNCFVGRNIANDPKNMIIAFPTLSLVRKFYKQKLKKFIKSTPVLVNKVENLEKASFNHINFEGGFLSMITVGTAEEAKSSVSPIIIVEEPDGVKGNLDGQGDGLAILKQRVKSFSSSKIIYAGTPQQKARSNVERAFETSNKMYYMVPCHKCGDFHTLSFKNLICSPYSGNEINPRFGKYNPKTVVYLCPICKTDWSFEQKNANVKAAVDFNLKGWKITNPEIKDVYGFSFNELLSNFEASNFVSLAEQYNEALHTYHTERNDGLLRSFINNSEGRGYEPISVGIDIKELKERRIDYPEGIVPFGGLILTAGIDVQHNRFALIVRAWGRNNNSWLVSWIEIFGNVKEWDDLVWEKLTTYMTQHFPHVAGNNRFLKIAGITIDCSDGNTAQLVYRWVLKMNSEHNILTYAGKGIAEGGNGSQEEIFKEPTQIDPKTEDGQRKSLASSMGVNVYLINAHKAHLEILRRVANNGKVDRYYHNKTNYGMYEEGLLSCVQLPDNTFVKKPSANKEVIDCEKMALHASFGLQIRDYTNLRWKQLEDMIYDSNKQE